MVPAASSILALLQKLQKLNLVNHGLAVAGVIAQVQKLQKLKPVDHGACYYNYPCASPEAAKTKPSEP